MKTGNDITGIRSHYVTHATQAEEAVRTNVARQVPAAFREQVLGFEGVHCQEYPLGVAPKYPFADEPGWTRMTPS